MPLPDGPAAKAGDTYESRWTARQILSVPRAIVRRWEADADRMVSANMLIS
jgi:hypothetical protein